MFKKAVASALIIASMQSAHAGKIDIDVDFGNQQVTVSTNGMEITIQNKKLYRKRVQMVPGRIAIGSFVITDGNSQGKIVAMNPTTKVITIQRIYDGELLQKTLAQIAVTQGCDGAFCTGDNVITDGHSEGKIVGFFANGTIVIQRIYDGELLQKTDAQLALTDVCDGLFCTGDKVITDGNSVGRVAGILSNGTIIVRRDYDGELLDKAASQLSVTSAICANIYINRVTSCR